MASVQGWALAGVLAFSVTAVTGCELALSVDRSLADRLADAGSDAGPPAADSGSDAAQASTDAGSDAAASGAGSGHETRDAALPPCLDSDGDGVCNLTDLCPTLADAKQRDSDRDGVGDVCDACPNDARKVVPGMCGCGASEEDSDADGRADCVDVCATDPAKTAAGACGCGVADVDHDGDGSFDCQEGCPNDPAKITAGVCGCGVADTDSDADGTANCQDPCPLDNPDDRDGDGVCESRDACAGDDASGDTDHDRLCDDRDPCRANAALSACSGSCVNLATDHDHCGTCAAACGSGETCSAGQCVFAGAALSFTLSWSEPSADLDLYVRTPASNVIYYGNPTQDGGTKYTDSAAGPGAEQIVWAAGPPTGTYEVCVVGFMLGVDTDFRVEVAKLGSVAQSVTGRALSADANMSVATCVNGDVHDVLTFSY